MLLTHHWRQGLTLVELLISFLILAVGIVAILGLVGQSSLNARSSADRTIATFLASRRMEELVADPQLQPQRSEGFFEVPYERFRWLSVVEEWEPTLTNLAANQQTLTLYRVQVIVSWRDRGRERRVELTTLVMPGVLQPVVSEEETSSEEGTQP
ncbi:MAG: prepilin-type N-terminal cleavage/methylation domain-containing protein [Armatimonadetes bacterium]|nr:prepilin-type N-terminal cleavage/methylation domain-containing protein [Armatimonadota bacterium]MDW8121011.1 prepilin-type N-terminal cleavage/methylation domain-containing protein [Armatimonadota bacterium]